MATLRVRPILNYILETKFMGCSADTGLLRFADRYEAVESLRNSWEDVGKISFNSKVRLSRLIW